MISKFLSLAAESEAGYIVTNDRRHLLRLKQHGSTKIVTPGKVSARTVGIFGGPDEPVETL